MDNKYQLISFNKEYISTDNFRLELSNRAFRYGDGFFETMHANGLDIQFVEEHYKRIIKATKILKLNLPDFFSLEFLKNQISGLLTRRKLFQAARIKLTIYRTGEGYYIPNSNSSDILIEAFYLGKGPYELNSEGIIIGIYDEMHKPKSIYSSIKSINAQFYIMAGIFAKENRFDDVLLLNEEGFIIEATSSNIFVVKGKTIITPNLTMGCVEGIMRDQIISIAQQLGYKVLYNNITPKDLLNMDELFLTNAIVGVKYVSGYKNKRFFKRTASKLMHELNNNFNIL